MQQAHIELELVNGRGTVLLDPDDFELLQHHRWYLYGGRYAGRPVKKPDGKQGVAYMHREVMGLEPRDKVQVDHINGDKLDNRRQNLRIVTQRLNKQNLVSREGSASQYRGVLRTRNGSWAAQVVLNGQRVYGATFPDELTAARHAARARIQAMPNTSPSDHELAEGIPPVKLRRIRPYEQRPSPRRGVTFCQASGKWRVQVKWDDKLLYFGRYEDQQLAIHLADILYQRRQDGLDTTREVWVPDAIAAYSPL